MFKKGLPILLASLLVASPAFAAKHDGAKHVQKSQVVAKKEEANKKKEIAKQKKEEAKKKQELAKKKKEQQMLKNKLAELNKKLTVDEQIY